MRLVIQRVKAAKVTVLDELVSSIGAGFCVLVGIKSSDTEKDVEYLVRKLLAFRLFDDENNKRWQKSVKDQQLEILCVSQFTLYYRLKGNKPDFSDAMKPDDAQKLYSHFVERLRQSYEPDKIKDGKFREYMQLYIQNDGPVTLELDSPEDDKNAKTKKSTTSKEAECIDK